MSGIALTATQLWRDGRHLHRAAAGNLEHLVHRHLRGGEDTGLVILGQFGSGKTTLCGRIARTTSDTTPCTVVPLRDVARVGGGDAPAGLLQVLGATRLEEARAGNRVLLLDGLDEVCRQTITSSYPEFFEAIVAASGPRWVLTSRPGYFRTDLAESPEQVDTLTREGVMTVAIDPLPPQVAREAIGGLPGGPQLLASVENLSALATSPLLLHVVHEALPHIEPGRPIHAWGVFDAWIRRGFGVADPDTAVEALEGLARRAWETSGRTTEVPTFHPDQVSSARVAAAHRRGLFVSDLDGRLRFGHRSVYEFLLASHIAPRLVTNQGKGPDDLSGVLLSEAMRVSLVGRVSSMPVVVDRERTRIPRGNFVAGGDLSADERPLRIQHLPEPVWIARAPVTNRQWADYLGLHPDDRVDANYLPHWGTDRRLPAGREEQPVYGLWPEDADRFAARSGARLPSANEWEKAARGLDGRRWPWGDYWVPGRAVTAEIATEAPLPVRALGAHGEAALFSAAGGAFEYTSSAYREGGNRGRIVMGGCYTHTASVSRVSLRLSHKLSGNLKAGLRLAWDDVETS